jgi:hypothetical protein
MAGIFDYLFFNSHYTVTQIFHDAAPTDQLMIHRPAAKKSGKIVFGGCDRKSRLENKKARSKCF